MVAGAGKGIGAEEVAGFGSEAEGVLADVAGGDDVAGDGGLEGETRDNFGRGDVGREVDALSGQQGRSVLVAQGLGLDGAPSVFRESHLNGFDELAFAVLPRAEQDGRFGVSGGKTHQRCAGELLEKHALLERVIVGIE